MTIPSVVHPKRFLISGIYFEVVSYAALTDTQAAKLVQLFYASRKFTRRDCNKVFRVISIADQNSAGLL